MKEETVYLSEFDDETIFQEAAIRLQERYAQEAGTPFDNGRVSLVYVGGELEAVEEESGVILYEAHY